VQLLEPARERLRTFVVARERDLDDRLVVAKREPVGRAFETQELHVSRDADPE
jgi:hypothetical protein